MRECVDLANMCMMMWDNLGREQKESEKVPEGLKGDGEHEFGDIHDDDWDGECVHCGIQVDSSHCIAGAILPCHEEQRESRKES